MKGKTILIAAVLAMGAGLAFADPDPAREAVTPFDALRLSAELARTGEANRDAWALVTAARIRRMTPVRDVSRTPEGGTSEAPADKAEQWLALAEELGGDDPRLASLVREVRAISFKGRAGGPQISRARLAAGGLHRYGEPFVIGRPAVVYVEGDGDTELALVVRGPDGNTACAQFGPGDVKMCSWTARLPGRYAVEVANRGPVANAYALATN